MATYNLNPYTGNINPSTPNRLKFFLKATEERKGDARLKCSRPNVKNLMSALKYDARKLGWSALLNIVPSDANGQNLELILKNFSEVTVEMSKKQARTT